MRRPLAFSEQHLFQASAELRGRINEIQHNTERRSGANPQSCKSEDHRGSVNCALGTELVPRFGRRQIFDALKLADVNDAARIISDGVHASMAPNATVSKVVVGHPHATAPDLVTVVLISVAQIDHV
jgi:hypothetical protein